jgi:uncharacterized RDD family membrane protein YckC
MEKETIIEKENIEYGKFWIRTGAYVTDAVILMIIVLPVTYLNISEYKSFSLALIIAILAILYKPLLEYYYGATIGKYAFDLKVTDTNFNKMNLPQSFLRSSILIIPSLLFIPITYFSFNNPEIIKIDTFIEYGQAVALNYPIQYYITKLTQLVLVLEIIFLLTDKSKKERALHDRIGKTYVIKTKPGNK